MSYAKRLTFLSILDSFIVLSSVYLSVLILYSELNILASKELYITSFTLLAFHQIISYKFHLYHKAWEYASIGELTTIFRAVTLTVIATAFVQYLLFENVYIRALVLTWLMYILFIGGSRLSWRLYRNRYLISNSNNNRTLIIGAGAAGRMLVRQLINNRETEVQPVAFIDDNIHKHKLEIFGLPVLGGTEIISEMVKKYEINQIVIAIPSLDKERLNSILKQCARTKVKVVIMPKVEDVMLGNVSINHFRDVQVEDLLGRKPVDLDMEAISKKLKDKIILVTGAGGSIGSEICRQVCKFQPQQILLLGHGENSIYKIDLELRAQYSEQIEIIPIIADVQDRVRIFEVMSTYKPDYVYHAAAHKHVPLMEYNPREAVKNNVLGTKNVAEAADTFAVGTFVLVSSDKAVNPTNVMGSTKRIAEMVIQNLATHSHTKFVAVRFGNVLGSRGSVIPLFKKQIQSGGPVTVTHPDMTRYFMTIPEASRLVIQAGALARGGEVFVLDMGEPVKIVDLAKNLIQLSGYTVDEIGIEFSGIRPGEKMYEELLGADEVHPEAVFPKIFIGKAVLGNYEKVEYLLNNYLHMEPDEICRFVKKLANDRKNSNYLDRKTLLVNK